MSSIQTLCRLQAVDQEWTEKGRLYQEIKARLADQSELEQRRASHADHVAQLTQDRTALRDAELELGSLNAKAKAVDKALYEGPVMAPRELEAMRQNSEHLKRRIGVLEDEVLTGMARVEELEASVASEGRDLQAFETALAQERTGLTAQYAELRGRLQELRAEREALRGSLTVVELGLYDELRAQKGGQALAPLKEGVCQVCHVTLPWHKTHSVDTESGVITCEGCGRILFRG